MMSAGCDSKIATPGIFIAFEGCDASGKSTQGRRFAERIGAYWTREPGDTAVGARIRSLVLDHSPEGRTLHHRTEALLMAADRAQHVGELVRPLLLAGRDVVTDRYFYSSVAYQGAGRGLVESEVRDLSLWAVDGLLPDLVVLLRVDVDTALARLDAAARADRFESEGELFLQRAIDSYERQREDDPGRWIVVDGDGGIDDVAARVWDTVTPRLDALRRPGT